MPLVGKREQARSIEMLDRVSGKCPMLHVVVSPPSEDRGMSHADWEVMENKPGCFAPEKLEFLKR